MHFSVFGPITVSPIEPADRAACVRWLNDREIYQQTLRIPHPYTEQDFDQWLEIVQSTAAQFGEPIHFAIREHDELVGGIGLEGLVAGHCVEIGYWLARPWWGRGIMTAVVRAVCDYAFSRWGVVRITAHVFESNPASARVLEKCGFQCEGLLRKARRKEGRFLHCWIYALVR